LLAACPSLCSEALLGLLASALGAPARRAAALVALGDAAPRVLAGCLAALSPARSDAAAALLAASAPAAAAFPAALAAALAAAEAAGDKAARRTALALVLPPAVAYLYRTYQHASSAGKDLDPDGAAADAAAREEVASRLLQPLLGFFTAKPSRGGAPGASTTSSSSAAAGPALGAAQLHASALPCLRLALRAAGRAGAAAVAAASAKMLPEAGWPAGAAFAAAAATDALLPTTAEKAAAAAATLLHFGAEGAPAELLQAVVGAFAATLGSLFRQSQPTSGQLLLEAELLRLLDGPVGDAVAALPAARRAGGAFRGLSAAACRFGGEVMRHRSADVAAVRVLRRLMAALLPAEDDDGGGGGGGGAAAAAGGGSSSSGASSSASDSDNDSDSDSDSGSDGGGAAEGIDNAGVASDAAQLFSLVLAQPQLVPAMRAPAASPPPLPPAAHALPRPLHSLLSLAEAPLDGDPSAADPSAGVPPDGSAAAAAAAAPGASPSDPAPASASGSAPLPAPSAPSSLAAQLKKELCELLETLLDVQDRFQGGRPPLVPGEEALLQLAMASYGASLSEADRAVWSLARALNARAWRRAAGGAGEGEGEEVAALLGGPLAESW
jgi:hypothetical protein